jgi:hypothetical protein
MLGTHLDSVPTVPGINDDGSGTAALFGIIEAVEPHHGYSLCVVGHRGGRPVGSLAYTRSLEEEEVTVDKITHYFNHDMTGPPYPKFEIMGGLDSGISVDVLAIYPANAGCTGFRCA